MDAAKPEVQPYYRRRYDTRTGAVRIAAIRTGSSSLFAQGGGSVPNAVMPRRLPPSQLGLARRFYFVRLSNLPQ
jgi:hypothetical protein